MAGGRVSPERWAWLAIGLGVLSFATADLYYTLVFSDADEVPFPSIADALYLALYPACYVGLILLLKRRAGALGAGTWLDGLIGALGFAALASAPLIGAVVGDTGGDPLTVVVNIAYPLADVLLIAIVVGMLAVFGWRAGRTWAVVVASFAVCAVVDVIYLFQVSAETYVEGGLLDVGWPGAELLLAVAAWQRPRTLVRRAAAGAKTALIPATAGLGALALLLLDHYERVNEPAVWLASACIFASVIRFGLTFVENVRMLGAVHAEALTDALTGLGNGRALVNDLERRLAADQAEPATLTLFDLDGFKRYNDTFGHPAGDLLLQRLGGRIVAAAPALTEAARLVRSSHEHFDGNGYPDRFAGEQIPLGARIIAVCDAWDAMTTDRPYRPAMPREVALAELWRCAGTQFDPAVVDAFCAAVGELPPRAAA